MWLGDNVSHILLIIKRVVLDKINEGFYLLGATGVVTWKDSIELDDSLVICGSNTSRKGIVHVARIVGVPISLGTDTRVDTRCVRLPKIDILIGHRIASIHVDDLEVDFQGNAGLIFDNITTNKLSVDIYLSLVRTPYILPVTSDAHSRANSKTHSRVRPWHPKTGCKSRCYRQKQ